MNRHHTPTGWQASVQQRWRALAPRERLSLVVGGSVLGIGLLWMAGIAPALAVLQMSPERLRTLDAQLAQMQSWAAQAALTREEGGSQLPERSTVMGLIERSASELGAGTQLNVVGNQAVLRLQQVPPDALARQMDQLRRAARVMPASAELERDGNGWRGTITLTGPGLGD